MKRLIFLIVFSVTCVGFIYYTNVQKGSKDLPVINPVDVSEEMVDPELLRLGYGHRIGHFRFIDQDSNLFTDKDLKGKVYVAEYFFSTCKTICPAMNGQMRRIQRAYVSEPKFAMVSFTVDPENDTPHRLKDYALMHEANTKQWHFLTGSKEKLYRLARRSFFVLKPAEAQNQGDVGSDFIHTNNFVLVDKHRRIRGYYDGTSPMEVGHLIEDIALLLKEK